MSIFEVRRSRIRAAKFFPHKGELAMQCSLRNVGTSARRFGLAALLTGAAVLIGGQDLQAGEPATAANQVVVDNFTFSPQTLTVKAGSRVTWVNHDDVPHTATSTEKKFNSGPLDTDQSFSFVFDKPGEYPYFCAVHPHMTGKIIVK
jgi:plastocyanin